VLTNRDVFMKPLPLLTVISLTGCSALKFTDPPVPSEHVPPGFTQAECRFEEDDHDDNKRLQSIEYGTPLEQRIVCRHKAPSNQTAAQIAVQRQAEAALTDPDILEYLHALCTLSPAERDAKAKEVRDLYHLSSTCLEQTGGAAAKSENPAPGTRFEESAAPGSAPADTVDNFRSRKSLAGTCLTQ
jgi:hypothetical protein